MAVDIKELMKKVQRIRIVSRRPAEAYLSGDYKSVFKGRGIEFDEVREYITGDDIRSIDWNVTARMGHPFVKQYREERELTVLFIVDVSGSQVFGSTGRTKAEVAAELTCLLALSAEKNHDRIGLLLANDRVFKYLSPRKGRNAVMRLVREVLAAQEYGGSTDLAMVLRFAGQVLKRRSIIFIVSDFMCEDFSLELGIVAGRHDVICCIVSDPLEETLPRAGLIPVVDPESGKFMLLDSSSSKVRSEWEKNRKERLEKLRTLFKSLGIDSVKISTAAPFISELRKLFMERQLKMYRRIARL
jgi:uncharacterized protein (DUF58 family)